jgi:hypothetical protein
MDSLEFLRTFFWIFVNKFVYEDSSRLDASFATLLDLSQTEHGSD